MSLIVEDGTGLIDATSYASVAEADAYFLLYGQTAWTTDDLDNSQRELALAKATAFIDRRWGPKFRGTRNSLDQALQWPRTNARDNSGLLYPDDALPTNLKTACFEYAILVRQGITLLPNPPNPSVVDGSLTSETTSGVITRRRERVGSIEEDVSYEDPTIRRSLSPINTVVDPFMLPPHPSADVLMTELVRGIPTRTVRA